MSAVLEPMPGEDDLEQRKSVAQIERQALQVENGQPVIPAGVSPLVAMLASGQLQAEHVEKAMELQAQHDSYNAEKAFNVAMVEFRRNVGMAKKSGNNTHLRTSYSTLDDIVAAVSQPFSNAGLSYRFETEQNEFVSVTTRCVLAHELGHSITDQRTYPVEPGKGISLTQAIGIAEMYGKRRSLSNLAGIASSDDTDGAVPQAAPVVETLNDDEIRQVVDMLAACEDAIPGTDKRWRDGPAASFIKADNDLGLLIPRSSFAKVLKGLKDKLASAKESGE